MARVSVVIPTFNCAQFIIEAIESVLNQTYKNYEIIVVNDGSTDNTEEVLSSYLKKIKYIRQENGGPSKARNNGINNSKGEYIAFLDADDIWLPTKLKYQLDFFEKCSDISVVISNFFYFGEETLKSATGFERRPHIWNIPYYGVEKGYNIFKRNIFQDIIMETFIHTSTVIVRKSCFKKVGPFDERILAEDWQMWLRLAKAFKFGFIDKPLVNVRIYKESTSRSLCHEDSINHGINMIKYLREWIPMLSIKDRLLIRKCLGRYYFDLAYQKFCEYDLIKARPQFLHSIKNIPYFKPFIYYISTFFPIRWIEKIRHLKQRLNLF